MKKIVFICILMTIAMVLTAGEAEIGGVSIQWKIMNDEIEFTLSAKTEGWIALGVEPESMMKGADIYIGFVGSDDKLVVEDHFGNGRFSHKRDLDLGGSDEIIPLEGNESAGRTTFKFKRPLKSSDPNDFSFQEGQKIKVITAIGRKDSFAKHIKKGKGEITL